MFGIGIGELIVIAIVALLFIGPQKLPEVARQFGKFFVQFKRVTSEARQAVDDVIKEAEREVIREEHQKFREALEASKPVSGITTDAISEADTTKTSEPK